MKDVIAQEEFFERMSTKTKNDLHAMFEDFVYKHATCTACATDPQGRSSQNYLTDELRSKIVEAEIESWKALTHKQCP